MDKKGKDSWRHKAAGADTVIVASSERIVMVKDENFGQLESIEKYFVCSKKIKLYRLIDSLLFFIYCCNKFQI
jgi:hypothetical protein